MTKGVQITLILVGAVMVTCLLLVAGGCVGLRTVAYAVTQVVDSDPIMVSEVSGSIVDFALPAGFGNGYVAQVAGYSLVSYMAEDEHTHIYLIQAPPSLKLDRSALEQQANQAVGSNDWNDVTVVERQPCNIRGDETVLVVSEGINHDGNRYRSASAIFAGNEGLALVNISGPTVNWDQEMVDTFMASLH
ncbi:MAG: hypothetical protein DWQ04_06130 [Chloroflexi bacterium]|nr:MAG: hypothetical protein DWQ04_06130 [Chloroflexota bacterium]